MRNPERWVESKYEQDSCGAWYASRRNVPLTSRLIVDRLGKAYFEAITEHASGRLADLGCGAVPLYGMYRELVSEVFCVDWPQGVHDSIHVDLFADLNVPIEMGEQAFDTVLATDVIEHLHTPSAIFQSAARALRPGGKLIIGVPFLYWIHEDPHDYHRYTRYALERHVAAVDLSVVSLTAVAGAPEVLADVAVKALAFRPQASRAMYFLARGLLALPLVQRLSRSSSATIPIAYVLVAEKK